MNIQKKLAVPLAALALVVSAGGGIVAAAHADTSSSSPAAASAVVTSATDATTSTTAPSDAQRPKGHAPAGGDGIVSSINGSTIVMAEESDEGGASYTIDASSAVVTKNGAASSLAGVAVGDKIFVQGTTNGTSVVATSISDGHGGHRGGPDNDTNASQ